MKKQSLLPIITLILIIIIIISGIHHYFYSAPYVYSLDKEWKFSIKNSKHIYTDTITLKIYDESSLKFDGYEDFPSGTYAKWDFTVFDDDSNYVKSTIESITEITDKKGNIFSNLLIRTGIKISSPAISNYLHLAELLPTPQIKHPIQLGNETDWEITFGEYKFISKENINYSEEGEIIAKGTEINSEKEVGEEIFTDFTATGKIQVSKKIFYGNKLVNDSCWVLDGTSESKLGNLKVKYYFHEKLGFVYFYYDFNKYQVEMKLLDIK